MEIELRRIGKPSLVTIIDDEDAALVTPYRWSSFATNRSVYARRCVGSRTLYLHTFLTGWAYVDHVDHDGLNNRRSNLRPTSRSLNSANGRSQVGSSSRFKGVCWLKRDQKWYAQIQTGRKNRAIGRFADEADAARAYDAVALELFGEHAFLNFGVSGNRNP